MNKKKSNYSFPAKAEAFNKALEGSVIEMWKRTWKFWVVALILVILFSGTRFITNSIYQNLPQQTEVAATSPQTTQDQNEEVSTQPTVVLFIAFPLLFAILVAVFIWAVADAKRPHKGKTGKDAKTPITEILQQPVIAALGGVIILNILASLFAYPAWKWYFDHHVLFASTNMGLPIFVHFIMKKDNVVCKCIAWSIVALMVTGFFYTSRGNLGSRKRQVTSSAVVTSRSTQQSYAHVPGSIAVPAFCDAESGDGSPGSARQLWENEAGEMVTVRNPRNGKPGTGAVGACQINLNSAAVVTFFQEHGFTKEDVEQNRADNYKVAYLLYDDYVTNVTNGIDAVHPWEETRDVWEKRLSNWTWGGEATVLAILVPVEEFTNPLPTVGFYGQITANNPSSRYAVEYTGYTKEEDVRKPFVVTRNFVGSTSLDKPVPGKVNSIRMLAEEEPTTITVKLTPKNYN